ncbi:TIGR03067 domain-containing protein [Blastopirellula marina]|uniref:TIGR03067 domain-containing protein n=1 Tax=Blastopirellula marina TaxID=124 RepID=A0A2S8G6V9_9BACT|nr:TIGR03067 domain-containing protein [Blastopirellula marina]PQO40198.1 hypothetical protein C5Y98_06230 [Blastopirellula marina]PTL45565.1 TIGR03067 domain-containing protein [Blastopirellula marina]
MKSRIAVTLALCFVAAVTCVAEEPSLKDPLLGTWILSEGETNGKDLKEALKAQGLDGLKVKFADGVMSMTGFGGPEFKYKYSSDPTAKPTEIHLTTEDTQGKVPQGLKMTGIYQLEGDVLKLCLPNKPADGKPTEFTAPSGSNRSLLTLKRQAETQ